MTSFIIFGTLNVLTQKTAHQQIPCTATQKKNRTEDHRVNYFEREKNWTKLALSIIVNRHTHTHTHTHKHWGNLGKEWGCEETRWTNKKRSQQSKDASAGRRALTLLRTVSTESVRRSTLSSPRTSEEYQQLSPASPTDCTPFHAFLWAGKKRKMSTQDFWRN